MNITSTCKDPANLVKDNLTFKDIEFSIFCLVKKIINSGFLISREYKFRLDEINRNDREKFIEYLIKNFAKNG